MPGNRSAAVLRERHIRTREEPGGYHCRHDAGRTARRRVRRHGGDAAALRREGSDHEGEAQTLLHPQNQPARYRIPQQDRRTSLYGTRAGRFDLSAEREHRGRDRQAVEPAPVRRRQGRRHDRRRQRGHGDLRARTAARLPLALRRRGGRQGPPEGHHREAATQNGRRAVGLRDRQEYEAHQEIFRREGFPQCGGERAHRERSRHPERRERHLRDRPQTQGQDRQDQFPRQRTVQGQAPAPHLQEDAPEEHQLLQVVETQGGRLRNGQGEPHRLLQLERLPQLHDPERLDLPDQRPPTGYRPLGVGGQQVLHPQHHMGRQLGLPDQRPATHVRRQIGRHLRQEDDQQAAGLRQGGQPRRCCLQRICCY